MSESVLIIHDREMHLETNRPLVVGETIPVIRGNGPREGDRMGTATITAIDEHGTPALDVQLGPS